jgi:hypothetical protein
MACHNGCQDAGCHAGRFFETCGHVNDKCSATHDFHCSLDEAVCLGKYHQTADGVIGLKLIKTEEMTTTARCGPHGKCHGALKITAELLSPKVNETWMECTIPVGKPQNWEAYAPDAPDGIHDAQEWLTCKTQVAVADAEQQCNIALDATELEIGVKMKGSCWLEDVNGTHLTQNAHFLVENIHNDPFYKDPCPQ